jgi:hypothetical protein
MQRRAPQQLLPPLRVRRIPKILKVRNLVSNKEHINSNKILRCLLVEVRVTPPGSGSTTSSKRCFPKIILLAHLNLPRK